MEAMKENVGEKTGFGAFLRRLREKRGLSLRQVELKSGVSHSYLSQLENQQKIPSAGVLSKLAAVYRVELTSLLEEAGLMQKKIVEHKSAVKQDGQIAMPPGLKELSDDSVLMEKFNITPFEINRLAEFQYRRGAKLGKHEYLLFILFLRQIKT